MLRNVVRAGLGLFIAAVSLSRAFATNGVWTNSASGGLWSAPSNWSLGTIANAADGIADFSTLNLTADNTVHLDSARTIGQLIFADTTPSSNWILDNNGNAANTLTMAVSTGAPAIAVNNRTATIDLSLICNGVVTKNGAGALVLSGSGDNVFTGMNVTAGTVVLAKASSHSPDVHAIGGLGLTVSGGTVQLAGTGGEQIYDFATVAVNGGTLDTNGRNETIGTLNLQGAGVGGAGALVNNGFNTFSTITPTNGTVLTGNATIGVSIDSAITLNNVVSGNFALTKVGLGGLLLTGANSFSGGLNIQNGSIQVSSINNALTNGVLGNNSSVMLGSAGQTGTLIYEAFANATSNMPFVLATGGTGEIFVAAGGVDLTLNGAISGAGALLASVGNLTLGGNNTFTGGVTIEFGTLKLAHVGALNSTSPNRVTFSGGGANGTLTLNGNSVTISGLSTNPGVGTPVVQNASATSATLTVNNSADNTFNGVLANGTGAGTFSLVKSGSGTLTLGGVNTFTGGVTINAGTLQLANAGALNTSGVNPVFFGPGSTGALKLAGNSVTVSALSGNSGSALVQNGSSTPATLTVNSGGITVFGAAMQDGPGSAPLSFVKNGGGIINLIGGGNESYTGTTVINGGELELETGNSLVGGITINGSSLLFLGGAGGGVSPAVVTFGPGSTGSMLLGVSGTIGGLRTDSTTIGAPTVMTSGSVPATLTINNAAANTFAGILQDGGMPLSIAKSGAGALTLSGSNTFTGTTSVSSGTLVLGSAAALGSTAAGTIVNSGGTLDLHGQTIGAEPLAIQGTGVGGDGALVNLGSTPASLGGVINGSVNGQSFTIGGSGDITLSGAINGNTLLTKIGVNSVTISGTTDDFGLSANVNAGTLILAKTSSHTPDVHAIGGNAPLFGMVVGGGTAQLGGTGGDQIYDFANVTITSGAFDANGRSEAFAALKLQGTGFGGAGALVNTAAASSVLTPTSTMLTGNTTVGVAQAAGSLTLNNAIAGNFGLTKIGAGTLILNGNNSYGGTTTVIQGTLLVNGAHTGGGAYNVLNAGTLGGVGNIGSNVTIDSSSFLSPGTPIGTFSAAGVALGGTLHIDINEADPNVNDVLNVVGNLALSGAKLEVALSGNRGHAVYVFSHYGSLSGDLAFASVNLGSLPAGYSVDYNYANSHELALVSYVRGDFNRDGHVNNSDIPAMMAALADLKTYADNNAFSNSKLLSVGDINTDGQLNNTDLQALLNLLKSGGGSLDAVPEPNATVLLAMAIFSLVAYSHGAAGIGEAFLRAGKV